MHDHDGPDGSNVTDAERIAYQRLAPQRRIKKYAELMVYLAQVEKLAATDGSMGTMHRATIRKLNARFDELESDMSQADVDRAADIARDAWRNSGGNVSETLQRIGYA